MQHRLLVALLTAVTVLGCASAPMTNRRQLLLIPESNEVAMGLTAYEDFVADASPSTNGAAAEMVQQVGQRIARVANRPDYDWEFRLVRGAEQNAFCLPGGKVVVYEGILPVCQSEAGLAVVMAHEIAHALARHGGERMSQGYVVDGIGRAVAHLTSDQEERRQEQVRRAYGMATQYGFVLPYSRKHESEADQMGMILMAQAGYDPREAPRFWERFARVVGGTPSGVSEYLSTHPADERRAEDLIDMLPEALAIYNQVGHPVGVGQRVPLTKGSQVHVETDPGVAGQHMVGQRTSVPAENHLEGAYGKPSRRAAAVANRTGMPVPFDAAAPGAVGAATGAASISELPNPLR